MPFQLTQIQSSQPIGASLVIFNDNFSKIQSAIDGMQNLLSADTNKLKLTALTSIPTGGIEAASVILTKSEGIAMSVAPSGGTSVFSVSTTGDISTKKITAVGDDSGDPSLLNYLKTAKTFTLRANQSGVVARAEIDGILDLNQPNSKITHRLSSLAVANGNTGAAAASPIAITGSYTLLDFSNGGVVLSNNSEANIDPESMELGQISTIICSSQNTGGARLNNGTVGSEKFAVIDPNSGIVALGSTNIPEFDTASGLSSMVVVCTNVGGTKKMLIIEASNVLNVY